MNLLEQGVYPKEALPDILKLVRIFNLALDEEMERFEMERDSFSFQESLETLSKDLMAFINNFDTWRFEAENDKEKHQLASLSREIDEAKSLVARAARLVNIIH